MSNLPLLVMYRLAHSYCWKQGYIGQQVELASSKIEISDKLLGLSLLSHVKDSADKIMQRLSFSLQKIQISSFVISVGEQPCLFIACRDEGIVIGHLKNLGVVIAETPNLRTPC